MSLDERRDGFARLSYKFDDPTDNSVLEAPMSFTSAELMREIQLQLDHGLELYNQCIHWLYVEVLKKHLPGGLSSNCALLCFPWKWPLETYRAVHGLIWRRVGRETTEGQSDDVTTEAEFEDDTEGWHLV